MTGPVWSPVWAALWEQLLGFMQVWGVWIALVSGLLFVISIALMPYVVTRIPVDYFSRPQRYAVRKGHSHPVIEGLLIALKNLSGAVLLLLGVIMLFGPGPGLITLFFGLYLMNFPGKYRLECWFMHQPAVLRQVNAMRLRRGLPPLDLGCQEDQ